MFTGARKKWEMYWQLVAIYFTVKSTDIFAVQQKRRHLQKCGTSVLPVRFSTFRIQSTAIMLRPKCRSYGDAALVLRFETASM